ncbi:MAG: hypothetical protein ACR2LM_07915 [Pyrinomonadaceae bacterium]
MLDDLRRVEISNGIANIVVSLEFDGERESTQLLIDGISYHFERIKKERLMGDYKVDGDPDYEPQSDVSGYCYLIAPYCK